MENSTYIYKNGKKLRIGYTTGSCAAAAAKAAVKMLFTGRLVETIEIDTPKGIVLKLDVTLTSMSGTCASCYVVKDAGDDPDITNGISLHAKAKMLEIEGVQIKAGEGIGTVTRAGLPVEPGKPAINPVPMKMILEETAKVLPKGKGVEITLSIPNGEELAKRTYNPRLGIVGGLSILGTSGIVEPMSEEAIKDTIYLELRCRRLEGSSGLVLVPGNYGEDYCKNTLHISDHCIVKVSNYIGFALEKCQELGFKDILLVGHIGKLVKPAGGIFYTHSRISDTRMEILAAHLGVLGMPRELLQRVMECRTTEEALPIIEESGYQEVYSIIANRCAVRCEEYVYGGLNIGVVLFSMKKLLAKSHKAEKIREEVTHA